MDWFGCQNLLLDSTDLKDSEKNFYFHGSKGFPCCKEKIQSDGKKWGDCLESLEGSKGKRHVIFRN